MMWDGGEQGQALSITKISVHTTTAPPNNNKQNKTKTKEKEKLKRKNKSMKKLYFQTTAHLFQTADGVW